MPDMSVSAFHISLARGRDEAWIKCGTWALSLLLHIESGRYKMGVS